MPFRTNGTDKFFLASVSSFAIGALALSTLVITYGVTHSRQTTVAKAAKPASSRVAQTLGYCYPSCDYPDCLHAESGPIFQLTAPEGRAFSEVGIKAGGNCTYFNQDGVGQCYTVTGLGVIEGLLTVTKHNPRCQDISNIAALTTVPTFVNLISFTGVHLVSYVDLRWETASEIDNAGFNLYRTTTAKQEKKVKINQELIPTKVPPGSPIGAVYDFRDLSATNQAYYYWLEDVDIYGKPTLHDPILVKPPIVE